MKKQCENVDPLPAGWLEELQAKADLERAFALLRPVRHFYAEAWKGRLRSLQMRWDAAWKHFDKASRLAEEAPETIPDLIRRCSLNTWCFQQQVQEAQMADDGDPDIEEAWIPDLPEEVLEEYPEVRLVIRWRRESEAMLRLHLGHYNDAAELYQELIEDKHTARLAAGEIALLHLGLAASEHNLGFPDRAARALENAGLCIAAAGKALERLHIVSFLIAFHSRLGRSEEVEGWKAFLGRVECPAVTRKLYLRRADMILERMEEARAFLIL